METKEHCIIIKAFYPYKQKLSVITQTMGKINLVCPASLIAKMRPGMVLACIPEALNETTYHTRSVELIRVPTFTHQRDFYCFHHLAELCYYAVPLASPCDEIFYYLNQTLVRLESILLADQEQISFHALMIAQLLILIGFYPRKTELSSLFIDFAKSDTIDCLRACILSGKKQQESLNAWIIECLKSHPSYKQFKTLPFMYAQETTFFSSKEKP